MPNSYQIIIVVIVIIINFPFAAKLRLLLNRIQTGGTTPYIGDQSVSRLLLKVATP
jgi:hypothetical protein